MQLEQVMARAPDVDLAMERSLVARAASEPEAFGELYDRYVGRIYRFAYRRLGSHADAEDLTAQTFRRALEFLDRYEWRGLPFGAWLFRIANNLVTDWRRRGGSAVSLDRLGDAGIDPGDPDTPLPEDDLVAHEEGETAWAAVATLPVLQRRAVTLRFGRDLSHAEVGVIIGRSEAATKQLIYRAMKSLRSQMEATI